MKKTIHSLWMVFCFPTDLSVGAPLDQIDLTCAWQIYLIHGVPTKSLILWGGEGILGAGPPDVSDKPVRVNKKARAIGAGFDHISS